MEHEKSISFEMKELKLYKKKSMVVHYIKSTDVKPKGETITIHTLEGDVKVFASQDRYIMIGPCHDVYPITKATFESKYEPISTSNQDDLEYIIQGYGVSKDKIYSCKLVRNTFVYARQMEKEFSVYVNHCNSRLHGKIGDYYVRSKENPESAYIIDQEIMKMTYEEIELG